MRGRVLLVEDDAQMREELMHIFQLNHIRVSSVGTGADSVKAADREDFDAALVDIKLPDCNGVDLIGRLRIKHPDCVYIIMTAYASIDTAIQALKNGVQDYVLKPFSPEEIMAAVKRGLEAHDHLVKGQGQTVDLMLQKKILEEKLEQVRSLNQVFVGREQRILELKREVNELRRKLGEPEKYKGC